MELRPRRRLEVLTNSRAATYQRCPRRHFHRYEQGAKTVRDDEDQHLGTLLHTGLDAWWSALDLALRKKWETRYGFKDAPLDPLAAALFVVERSEPDPFMLARAQVMLAGHHQRWARVDVRPLAVESEFYVPLINPDSGQPSRLWMCGGKLDVFAIADGEEILIDNKSTKENLAPTSDYWKRLRMDTQISNYFRGARILGRDPKKFVYNVLGKPDIRPLKATPVELRKYTQPKTVKGVFEPARLYATQRENDETPAEFRKRLEETIIGDVGDPIRDGSNLERWFVRHDVPRLDSDLEEHGRDLWDWAKKIRDSQITGRWPRTPAACNDFHRLCEYFDVCSGAASIDDRSRFRQDSNPHSELLEIPPDDGQVAELGATAAEAI